MITRVRIRIATALAVMALGGIVACGHLGASADVTGAAPSTSAPSTVTSPSSPAAADAQGYVEMAAPAPARHRPPDQPVDHR